MLRQSDDQGVRMKDGDHAKPVVGKKLLSPA
jgi:hypothetical protein